LIQDNDKIATRWKQYLKALYQEGEAARLNNNNNPDMQGYKYLFEVYNLIDPILGVMLYIYVSL